MTPLSQKFSIFQIVIHEISRAEKALLKSDHTRVDILSSLRQHQTDTINTLTKYTISFFAIAAILNNPTDGNSNGIPGLFSNISIPSEYCQLAASYIFFAIVYYFNHLIVILTAKSKVQTNKYKGFRYIEAQNFLTGDRIFDFISPLRYGNLLRLSRFETVPIALLILTIVLTPVIAVLAGAIITFASASKSIQTSSGFDLQSISSVIAIVVVTSAFSFLIIYFTPLKTAKNIEQIRRGFLYPLLKDKNGLHHATSRWRS